MKLSNKVAIVTGSARGIGKAIAMSFASEGAAVVVTDVLIDQAHQVVDQIKNQGGTAIAFKANIANRADVRNLVKSTLENFKAIHILVNNAGIQRPYRLLPEMTEEDWDIILDVNVKGVFNCTQAVLGQMMEQRYGKIINISSVDGLGGPTTADYGAAKAGIVGLTRNVARELGRYGVTCNAYAPTAATRFTLSEDVVAGFKKRYEAGLMTKERFEELTNPPPAETVTPFLIYLCTDEAADINGQVFDVTGGNIALYSEPVKKTSIDKQDGLWTVDELIKLVPEVLLEGYQNPAPAEAAK